MIPEVTSSAIHYSNYILTKTSSITAAFSLTKTKQNSCAAHILWGCDSFLRGTTCLDVKGTRSTLSTHRIINIETFPRISVLMLWHLSLSLRESAAPLAHCGETLFERKLGVIAELGVAVVGGKEGGREIDGGSA